MHIAQFTNFYLPVLNGVVRSIHSFRGELTRKGHNVFIFAQESGYEDLEPFIFRYPSFKLPISVEVLAAIPISHFIDKLLPKLKLDVIHTHHPILLGQTAAVKANELNLPLVFTFHTQYREYTHYVPFPQETVQKFLKGAMHRWLKVFMRRCQHIIVPTESMCETLKYEYGLKDLCTVIPTGIDLAIYDQIDRDKSRRQNHWTKDIVMVSVGRLAPEKNWEVLIQAVYKVIKDYPQFRLVLIGDGPDRKHLEDLTKEFNIHERVTFTGPLQFSEIPTYMKAADLFGFASITETQGLVTLEAMAARLPIVAVDACGARDLIQHGRQGYLVENDPEALAIAIKKVLESPQRMRQFGEASFIKAQSFQIDAMTDKLLAVYEQAIHDKKKNRFVNIE